MARYSQWVRNNLDVVWEGSNGELYCRCPFKENHKSDDKNPSFGVNVIRGVFYCYGCHEKGKLDVLAKKLRVRLTEQAPTLNEIDRRVAALRGQGQFEKLECKPDSWLKQFCISDVRYEYWCDRRGLSRETVDEFMLGYERYSNSATIPIRDFRGNCLGIIRRRLSKRARPRYRYPKGFAISEHLWGAWKARGYQRVAVVEGSVDALACWDIGIPAVALLGSRLKQHQITLLAKLHCDEVVIMTDRDAEGIRAAQQVRKTAAGVLVSLGTYRESWRGDDPASITAAQRLSMFEDATPIRKALV